jgi:hypothetical protein
MLKSGAKINETTNIQKYKDADRLSEVSLIAKMMPVSIWIGNPIPTPYLIIDSTLRALLPEESADFLAASKPSINATNTGAPWISNSRVFYLGSCLATSGIFDQISITL